MVSVSVNMNYKFLNKAIKHCLYSPGPHPAPFFSMCYSLSENRRITARPITAHWLSLWSVKLLRIETGPKWKEIIAWAVTRFPSYTYVLMAPWF